MKFAIAVLAVLAAAALIEANPIQISNNNVGDIVTVGVNANAVLSNNVEANVITALMALLNQQAAIVGDIPNGVAPAAEEEITPQLMAAAEKFDISPENIVEKIKQLKISPELIERVKEHFAEKA